MIRKLSIGLLTTLWLVCVAYLGLLSNWFRYGLSLEATFVAMTLVLGTLFSSALSILSFKRSSTGHLVGAFVGTALTAFIVVLAQLHAFGEMPSLYANNVEKSPIGRIITQQGGIEYWLELENPFACSHREYIVIRRNAIDRRIEVRLFKGPVGGYVSGNKAADWCQLEPTSAPNIYLLKIGSYLPASGNSFRINLETGVAEKIQRADG